MYKRIILLTIVWLTVFSGKAPLPPAVVKVTKTKAPVFLSKVDFKDSKQKQVDTALQNKIIEIVSNEFTNSATDLDSTEFKGTVYFNTLQFEDSVNNYYLVIINSTGGGYWQSSRLLCQDKKSGYFYSEHFEYRIGWVYEVDKDKLVPTNLKKLFKLQNADIQLTDFNNDGVGDVVLTRQFHSAMHNVIETIALSYHGQKMDTLYDVTRPDPGFDKVRPD